MIRYLPGHDNINVKEHYESIPLNKENQNLNKSKNTVCLKVEEIN